MTVRTAGFRQVLAQTATRLLHRVNVGDLTIRNHWTGDPLRLHSFKHRTYWYHGRRRELDVLERLPALVGPGDLAVDVGAHIGYLTQVLSQRVGPAGRVLAFEPGANNLPYLTQNCAGLPNVEIVQQAVCDRTGFATFYLEEFSGQNNSLLASYESFKNNCRRMGAGEAMTQPVEVPCITLDAALADESTAPAFVKIDVEGAELQVLEGMSNLLERAPIAIMVEVTVDAQAVFDLLSRGRFELFSPSGRRITSPVGLQGNAFCLRADDPRRAAFASA